MRLINPKLSCSGCWIPLWLLSRTEIGASGKLVYCRLARFYDEKKGFAWTSHSTLQKSLGLAVSTVKKAIQELVDAGLIAARKGERTNEYRFLDHPWREDRIAEGRNPAGPDTSQVQNEPALGSKRATDPAGNEPPSNMSIEGEIKEEAAKEKKLSSWQVFCERYRTARKEIRGVDTGFPAGREIAALKQILASSGTEERAITAIRRFLADSDPWLVKNGHAIWIMHGRMGKYLPREIVDRDLTKPMEL